MSRSVVTSEVDLKVTTGTLFVISQPQRSNVSWFCSSGIMIAHSFDGEHKYTVGMLLIRDAFQSPYGGKYLVIAGH